MLNYNAIRATSSKVVCQRNKISVTLMYGSVLATKSHNFAVKID